MPEWAPLIAILIIERPLCVSCISSKSGLTHGEVESYLTRIEATVDVKQALDRCRTCGNLGPVFSLIRRDATWAPA
jgi:hypothetical protein